MRIDLTVRRGDGAECDVAVHAAAGAALGDVAAPIAALLGCQPRSFWSGRRRLTPAAPLGGAGLRHGDVLSLDEPAESGYPDGAVLRLQVVGGPDAGKALAIGRGSLSIGRAHGCDLVLADSRVSRRHASLTVTRLGISVRDLDSTNGTTIGGQAVAAHGTPLLPGHHLRVGDSFLAVTGSGVPAASLRASDAGVLHVNRPPRPRAEPSDQAVDVPSSPSTGPPQRVPWMAALIPAAGGAGMAWWMGAPQFLLFALLSPITLVGSALGERVYRRGSRRRLAVNYRTRLDGAAAEIAVGLAAEVALRHAADPDPATLLQIARTPGARLWERRRDDTDLMRVRVGLATVASRLAIRIEGAVTPAGQLAGVPVGVDLRSGPLGVAAPVGVGLGVAGWLVGQLTTLVSPGDLEIAMLLSDSAAGAWTWARWLPHLRGRVASSRATWAPLVAELGELVQARTTACGPAGHGWTGPWLLVVIDRAAELSELPGLATLLAAGGQAGVTAICLDERENRLPTACSQLIRLDCDTGNRSSVRGEGVELNDVITDRVGADWAERLARALAPLADSAGDPNAALPERCRLADLLDAAGTDSAGALARWARSDRTPSADLGVGVDGPVRIDLERDGPHTLVAGTTGSGKSEFLQTLVAGLASAHPPEEITFVLVDYKGGAAFAECARLPHTAGLVTDLDRHLVPRALLSLESELRRRETLFSTAGAKDLCAYRASRPGTPLARLVLVVDEFAALAEELPDFVTGLIAIAQRGRSLGVHLVLATQRPAGVVSPEIRANATLRVALRTAGPAESVDVIDCPDAAVIDRRIPGRALVRIGTEIVALQTAYVGGPAPSAHPSSVSVNLLDAWRTPVDEGADRPVSGTDLSVLVDALRQAAAASGRPTAHRPWLPPLPSDLPLVALASMHGDEPPSQVPVGLLDLPAAQLQAPFAVDLAPGGSVLVTGGPRSGRTTALVSLAITAASRIPPEDMHVHAIDFAGGGLGALGLLPHCGTAASGSDGFATTAVLLTRLSAEVANRRTRLARLGADSLAQARSGGEPVPLLLCVLDGWEAFVAAAEEHDAGRSVDQLVSLLRAAPAVGITVVIAGDRSTLAPRLAGSMGTRLILPLTDRADYAMAGIPSAAVPDRPPPGRAIRVGDATELQFGFAGCAPSRSAQARAAAECAERWRGHPPRRGNDSVIRIRALPRQVRLDALAPSPGRVLLGLGGDSADPVAVDLFTGERRVLVAGPARSGRSTVLLALLVQAVEDVRVVVAAPGRSPLRAVVGELGTVLISPDDGDWLPYRDERRTLLLVDDSEAFLDTAAGGCLTEWIRRAPAHLATVVAGRTDDLAVTYRGIGAEMRRSRIGLLLQPAPVDGELLGIRLPREHRSDPPGRAVLVGDPAWGSPFGEAAISIQVAVP